VEIEQSLFDRLNEAKQILPFTLGELRIILAAAPALIEQLGDRITAADAPTGEWLERLRAPRDDAPALDPTLDAWLRPYQRDGARWLLQCAGWAPGACLADEMGLGKTVQAIAVLLHRAALGPALVVAPTSLIDNWLGELARFAPSLQAAAYRGAERGERLATLAPGRVLVTSYDLVLRDCAVLAEHRFATQ
jgi:SNF2 family DNA or RNA helicase